MLSPDAQARLMGAAVSAAGVACVASVLGRWHQRLHPLATLLAPQVASEPGAGLPASQALAAWLLRKMEGHFGIQMDSLRRFNAKFQPRWVPRYLIYPSRSQLPAIGLAVLSAEGSPHS